MRELLYTGFMICLHQIYSSMLIFPLLDVCFSDSGVSLLGGRNRQIVASYDLVWSLFSLCAPSDYSYNFPQKKKKERYIYFCHKLVLGCPFCYVGSAKEKKYAEGLAVSQKAQVILQVVYGFPL